MTITHNEDDLEFIGELTALVIKRIEEKLGIYDENSYAKFDDLEQLTEYMDYIANAVGNIVAVATVSTCFHTMDGNREVAEKCLERVFKSIRHQTISRIDDIAKNHA